MFLFGADNFGEFFKFANFAIKSSPIMNHFIVLYNLVDEIISAQNINLERNILENLRYFSSM